MSVLSTALIAALLSQLIMIVLFFVPLFRSSFAACWTAKVSAGKTVECSPI